MTTNFLILGLALTTNVYSFWNAQFVEWNNLTSPDKEFVVSLYNGYRTEISSGSVWRYPAAESFRQMVWDNDLEEHAAMTVKTCQMEDWKQNDMQNCGSLNGTTTECGRVVGGYRDGKNTIYREGL